MRFPPRIRHKQIRKPIYKNTNFSAELPPFVRQYGILVTNVPVQKGTLFTIKFYMICRNISKLHFSDRISKFVNRHRKSNKEDDFDDSMGKSVDALPTSLYHVSPPTEGTNLFALKRSNPHASVYPWHLRRKE